jgi:hypothetical protein
MSSPSIVPFAAEPDTYLVLDDYGQKLGRAWGRRTRTIPSAKP